MKITVKRYDPSLDAEPRYVSGDIEYTEPMSALQALTKFYEEVEPIAFDMSCSGSTCGRCAVMINGTPALACITPVEENGEYTFEPLEGFPVVRDLVVDRQPLLEKIARTFKRVRLEPYGENDLIPPNFNADDDATMAILEGCRRCGICNTTCPALNASPDEYVGPAVQVATGYRYLDTYDGGDRLREAVANGLYVCIQCGKCDEVCPIPNLDHLGLWKRLRDDAEAAGLKPSYAE